MMQALLLCTVFLYDKKFITFPGVLGGASLFSYTRFNYFIVPKSFDMN